MQLHSQIENLERAHSQEQTQLSNSGVHHERRLKLYHSMLAHTHTLFLATLFGSFEWERVPDFELNGSLTHRALLVLRQLTNDLTRFLPSWRGFVVGVGGNILGTRFVRHTETFLGNTIGLKMSWTWYHVPPMSLFYFALQNVRDQLPLTPAALASSA